MGAGLCGLNGISPITSVKLINIYVLPRLTYGLECLTISDKEMEPISKYFRGLLKRVQHLPDSTADAACYLLTGCLPIEATIHTKTLNLFGAIMRRNDSQEFAKDN